MPGLPAPVDTDVIILTPGGLERGGGIGRLVGYLAEASSDTAARTRVHVLDSRGPGSVVWSPFYLMAALLFVTKKKLLGRSPLLHVNITPRASTARKMVVVAYAAVLRLSVVLHLHAEYIHYYRRQPRLVRRAIRLTFQSAERVVLLGHYWRKFMVHELGVDPARIEVLWNAVPRGPERIINQNGRPVRILYLAHRVEAAKGAPEILEALSDRRLRKLDWRATLAGAGDIEAYRKRVRELNLTNQVRIPGWLDRETASDLLQQSDILLLPSHTEALSMAVLEAMAHGLVVICTNVGALGEVVVHGESGLIVPILDSGALADALIAVINDPAYRARLSAGARKRHAEKFDISVYAARLASIWERTAQNSDRLHEQNATH